MRVSNQVLPSDINAVTEHLTQSDGSAIAIVNLLKFKARAEYADDRETSLTGEQAYQIYLDAVRKHLPQLGAREIFCGKPNFLLLGEVEPMWDKVLIIQYPNRQALVELSQLPAVAEAANDRAAGLEGQLAIETLPED